MTGILERIETQNAQILSLLQQAATGNGGANAATGQQQQFASGQGVGAEPLSTGLPAQTGASLTSYPPATQEMIIALVTPLVNDPNVKAALQQEMAAMGISALPDAQPHQYPELYARFQGVRARQQAAPTAAPAPASII